MTSGAVDRNGLEVLARAECLRLLEQTTLGRVAVTVGALPAVLPVNYRLVDDRIVFRTSDGSKLDAATRNAVVAFEVDEMEPMGHTGWSVMVTGLTREVTDARELEALESANIPRWAPVGGERIVEISTDMISGRRIGHAAPPQQRGAP
jgi:uncharacterized protein